MAEETDDDVLSFFGIKPSKKAAAAKPSAPVSTPHPDEDILADFGIDTKKAKMPEYVNPLGATPEDIIATANRQEAERKKNYDPIPAWSAQKVLPAWAARTGEAVGEQASAGAKTFATGASQAFGGGMPATGVGNMAMGALGTVMSPVTGAVKTTVEDPLTAITGNPDFGGKAALMFPLNMGGPVIRTTAHNIHPTTRAADAIAREVGDNMPEVLARLRSNPRLRPIDTNDQLRMMGQGRIADAESPEASRVLTESMRKSAQGARDSVKGTYNETMGPPPNLYEELERLQNKAQSIGRSKIAPALIMSKPVDTSNVIADIDKALNPTAVKMTPGTTITATPLQQKLTEYRQKLASGDKEVLTDAGRLHDIQSEMRVEADDLIKSATGSDRKLGHELKNYRNKLVDAIDASAPGYKDGLKAYKDHMDVERAYDFGKKSLSTTEEFDPSFVKAWVNQKGRTPEELEAARLGQRYAIEKKMGTIKQSALDPARSGTDVPQIEFNRKNIEHLFGKEQTERMFKHLSDERDIALTNNRGLANSKTAETEAYKLKYAPRDVSNPTSQLPAWATGIGLGTLGLSGSPTLGAMAGGAMLGARGAKNVFDRAARRNDVSRNTEIADLLTRNDPETRALLSVAAQRVRQRNKLQNLVAPP